MLPWFVGGFTSFGIAWIARFPDMVITLSIIGFLTLIFMAFPDVETTLKWRLHQMMGYYHCAIGEEGFTTEGHQDLKKAASWIFTALENHEMFFDVPLGAILNNGGLMKDVNTLVKEYATGA